MISFSDNYTDELKEKLKEKNVFVITDENVFDLYGALFENSKVYKIKPGEGSKTLSTVESICVNMLEQGCGRKTVIYAVGGGVVGDISGFAAAVFMRGVEWVSVPTTLLAQVDSGIGGKTGVDLEGYKNIVGAFWQPREILVSAHFLKTLPSRELTCGMGEIIKTSFLSPQIYEIVNSELNKLIAADETVLSKIVKMCAAFKEEIVKEDEKETLGLRKVLNLGHTIGHALEKTDNHILSHGEYVLWGLLIEGYITKNYVNVQNFFNNQNILRKMLKGKNIKFDPALVADAALADKKNENGKISIMAAVECGVTKEMHFTKNDIIFKTEEAKKEYGLN